MLEKCKFSSSAISKCSVIDCSLTLISEIFFTLFGCREENSFINPLFFRI